MALVLVIPINHEHRSCRINLEINPLRPKIVRVDEILAMACRITRSRPLDVIHIDPIAVDVVHHDGVAVHSPMFIAQVEHRTGMSMAPTGSTGAEVSGMRPAVAQPM